MTREEASNILKDYRVPELKAFDVDKFDEAVAMAIKSLEKETPRMVNYEGDGYADGYMVYDMAECPACGNRIDEEDVDVWEVAKYCPECGQRIIWEAENE